MNTKLNKLALAIGALAMVSGAWAANDTSTMAGTASVAAECAVGNGGTLAFGTLEMLNLETAAQTTVDTLGVSSFAAICTNGTTAPKFAYSSANKATNDFRLKGATTATEFITYTLYSSADSSTAPITGDTALAYGGAVAFVADGTSKTLAVSAKILAADKATKLVQAYTDIVTITASWTP